MRKTRIFIEENEIFVGFLAKIRGNDFDHLFKVMRKKVDDEI